MVVWCRCTCIYCCLVVLYIMFCFESPRVISHFNDRWFRSVLDPRFKIVYHRTADSLLARELFTMCWLLSAVSNAHSICSIHLDTRYFALLCLLICGSRHPFAPNRSCLAWIHVVQPVLTPYLSHNSSGFQPEFWKYVSSRLRFDLTWAPDT